MKSKKKKKQHKPSRSKLVIEHQHLHNQIKYGSPQLARQTDMAAREKRHTATYTE